MNVWLKHLYVRVMKLAGHRHAEAYLAGVSFLDASVFPISPTFMMAPMILSLPNRAWRLVLIASLGSALGGLLGYGIGYYAFEPIALPLIERFGYQAIYQKAQLLSQDYGLWALFFAGLSPIPYKIFTIGAGVTRINIVQFLLASLAGRTLRFSLIAAVLRLSGPHMRIWINQYLSRISQMAAVAICAYVGYKIFIL